MERVEELDGSLERLVGRRGVREGTSPPSASVGAIHAPLGALINYCSVQSQHFQMALFDRVHDAGWLITFMDYRISQLQQELDTLKYGEGPEAVAKAEEHAFELGQELEKTKRERDEAPCGSRLPRKT
ncbi:hypothetical protein B296_00004437 [Ensete ventricosum]|uniref:Uncharacterized protein n=1 Tax=Ensete ventricosum TaxID=4639 RepID=A0A427AAY8_ENSVE|nr:hypothetical protein B296_00004437 [Ensete ventricosum]